jgi:hypothetical protein
MTARKSKTPVSRFSGIPIDPAERGFFQNVMKNLNNEGIPYVVGGAFALAWYTGIERRTKDFDIFVLSPNCRKVLDLLSRKGYETDMTHPHWLGKVRFREFTVDVIYSSGNGLVAVDEHWFTNAIPGTIFGMPVKFAPVEEIIFSKAFIMERERFDGADIHHLILAQGNVLDWHHLLARASSHWKVLLAHLILFDFAYPSERGKLPRWVIEFLLQRFSYEAKRKASSRKQICYGTLLSREQYLNDVLRWGFTDGRAADPRTMTEAEIQRWTDAIYMDEHMNHGENRGKDHSKLHQRGRRRDRS